MWILRHVATSWSKWPAAYFELLALILAYIFAAIAAAKTWDRLDWPPGLKILLASATIAAAAFSIFPRAVG